MKVDRERVDEKAAYIREQIKAIHELIASKPRQAVLEDPWLVKGLKYSLQTAIEAVIDLAYHVCAKALSHAPGDARDAMTRLGESGVLAPSEVGKYQAMVGFRNRIVHGYQRVTDERVYDMAASEMEDFEEFLQRVYAFLDRLSPPA